MKIALYKGTLPGWRGWISRLVRFADRGPYSHCEVVFSDGMCASASWLDGGVRFKKIKFNPDHWDFIDIGSGWLSETLVKDWFEQRKGSRYDLPGSLGVVCRPLRQRQNPWFCSEAVAASLGVSEAWRISPNMLAALFLIRK